MPVDVFWLDIEYSEEHKYFIWDKKNFPDPVDMTNDVEALARKVIYYRIIRRLSTDLIYFSIDGCHH